jgi:hypothetical protein
MSKRSKRKQQRTQRKHLPWWVVLLVFYLLLSAGVSWTWPWMLLLRL